MTITLVIRIMNCGTEIGKENKLFGGAHEGSMASISNVTNAE